MAFIVQNVPNPELRINEIFPAVECFHHPRIRLLREQYDLPRIAESVNGEWNRILALRHWIRSRIEIENDNPTPCRMEAFDILDKAAQGGKFHCAHFSLVLHAVLNSCGYVTRRLQCGPGEKGDDGNHGVNEVWVNELCQWVLIDAKYDLHFEKKGCPLSALEIRDEVWRDGACEVVAVHGPARRIVKAEERMGRPETYRWCAWEMDTNHFTAWPTSPSSTLAVYADEIFKSHTWCRDGKPHWAYGTPFFVLVNDRRFIEWTPNVTAANVSISGETATIRLRSCTPNFRSFQMQTGGGEWLDCGDSVTVPLSQPELLLNVRSENLFGVHGPEHTIRIETISD